MLGEQYHLSSLSVDNFFTNPHSLAKTIILEGKSILTNKTFLDSFNLKAQLLYSYDLSHEEANKKVRFVYLLRGRGKAAGLVQAWKGEFISNNAFIVPIGIDEEIRFVFDQWKIKHQRRKILLMG